MIERDPDHTVARRIRTRAAARELRRRTTETEDLIWEAVRRRQIDGQLFRRQHPIGPYVVDFVCVTAQLVVEIDGEIHEVQREYDAERDDYLRALGYAIVRFTNDRVLRDLDGVVQDIERACAAPPPPCAGEGVGGRGLPSASTPD